jgi:hypothetical protein
MTFKVRSAPLIAPSLPKPSLQVKLRQAFNTAVRKGINPLVQNTDSIPAGLKLPASVSSAYKKLLPGTEDGSLSIFKMPFGKAGQSVYVVSYAGGDDSREDIFFSKSGKKMDDHQYSI